MLDNKASDIFEWSRKNLEDQSRETDAIIESYRWKEAVKVQKIIGISEQKKQLFLDESWELLDGFFDETGAIQIWITSLKHDLNLLEREEQQVLETIIERYCIEWKSNFSFRNNDYYFLFNSVVIDGIWENTSINDYKIRNMDFKQFRFDITEYLWNIEADIENFFNIFIRDKLLEKMTENKDLIFNAVMNSNIDATMDSLQKIIDEWNDESNEIKNQIYKQDKESYKLLFELKWLLDSYKKNPTTDIWAALLLHISCNKNNFNSLKTLYWLDIISIFTEYIDVELAYNIQKIYLWLLDAKINLFSFLQNISHIMGNKNFMNDDFEGNLIFSQSFVKRIKKWDVKKFNYIKTKQCDFLIDTKLSRFYALDIWWLIDNYLGLLLKGDFFAYIDPYLLQSVPNPNENTAELRHEFIFDLLNDIFSFLNAFRESYREDDKLEMELKDPDTSENINYMDEEIENSGNILINKLFRLFREENDPITIIRTAQNAFINLEKMWFTNQEVLHIMSVNYWWSLVGYYVKFIFEYMSETRKIFINSSNIVYSLYDLKNADEVSSMVDYPFLDFLWNGTPQENAKVLGNKKHWMLIFDDNTTTWRTLGNLRQMVHSLDFFEKIQIYACRTKSSIEGYQKYINVEGYVNILLSLHQDDIVNLKGKFSDKDFRQFINFWQQLNIKNFISDCTDSELELLLSTKVSKDEIMKWFDPDEGKKINDIVRNHVKWNSMDDVLDDLLILTGVDNKEILKRLLEIVNYKKVVDFILWKIPNQRYFDIKWELSIDDMIHLARNSWNILTKWIKNPDEEQTKYKERIGTLIGNRIYQGRGK